MQEEARSLSEALLANRREVRVDLVKLLHKIEGEASRSLKEAADTPSGPESEKAIADFRRKAADSLTFRQYASPYSFFLTSLDKSIEEIRSLAHSQPCYERTGYKSVGDWCQVNRTSAQELPFCEPDVFQDVLNAYDTVITAVSAVTALGAGLTYTTIFSAQKGNVTYMMWAFSLFTIGLVTITCSQAILKWGATRTQHPFLTVGLWEFFVAVGVFSAVGTLIAAFCLLLISVYKFNVNDGIESSGSSKTPAAVAFAAIGISLGVILIIFALFAVAHNIKALVWQRSIDRASAKKKLLQDYPDWQV
ncbi:uncharacterized protein EI90DRAFT_3119247 [Cantharellus anzutake]|uniref:uncharacterized protein n=1 Tax=Cantharellus anzutake TaxID=1750568 RepID=UPI001905F07A|nr:uncharacterized protein EI90DRAFT_3119247 [Cantharellus anzutake]KAF8336936.1 hypothetical protein EI90DRAFT_3119247 [Cantharellus anzutake]